MSLRGFLTSRAALGNLDLFAAGRAALLQVRLYLGAAIVVQAIGKYRVQLRPDRIIGQLLDRRARLRPRGQPKLLLRLSKLRLPDPAGHRPAEDRLAFRTTSEMRAQKIVQTAGCSREDFYKSGGMRAFIDAPGSRLLFLPGAAPWFFCRRCRGGLRCASNHSILLIGRRPWQTSLNENPFRFMLLPGFKATFRLRT